MTGVSRMTNRGSMVALLLEAVLVAAVFAVSGQAARARAAEVHIGKRRGCGNRESGFRENLVREIVFGPNLGARTGWSTGKRRRREFRRGICESKAGTTPATGCFAMTDVGHAPTANTHKNKYWKS